MLHHSAAPRDALCPVLFFDAAAARLFHKATKKLAPRVVGQNCASSLHHKLNQGCLLSGWGFNYLMYVRTFCANMEHMCNGFSRLLVGGRVRGAGRSSTIPNSVTAAFCVLFKMLFDLELF